MFPLLIIVIDSARRSGMPFSLENPCGAKTHTEDANGPTCTMPAGFRTDHLGQGRCYLHGGQLNNLKHGRYSKIKRQVLREAIAEHKEDPDILNMEPELAASRALFEDFVNRYDEITEALLAWFQSYREVTMTPHHLDMLRQVVSRYEVIVEKDQDVPPFMVSYVHECKKLINKYKEYYANSANFKPHQILDIAEAYKFLAEITKIVERIEKVRAQNAISRKNFMRVTNEMGRTVNTILDVYGTSVHTFDKLGKPVEVFDSKGQKIHFSTIFQNIKEKIADQWGTIQVQIR